MFVVVVYQDVYGQVCMDGETLSRFPIPFGVKQGCNASPTLFGLYVDRLAWFVHERYGYLDREQQ